VLRYLKDWVTVDELDVEMPDLRPPNWTKGSWKILI